MAQDPERLARFEREAEVPAPLNYSNIAHICMVGKSGGFHGLRMEWVPGTHF
jgi:hypothetical protein